MPDNQTKPAGVIFERDTDDLRRYLSEVNQAMIALDFELNAQTSDQMTLANPQQQLGFFLQEWRPFLTGQNVQKSGEPWGWGEFFSANYGLDLIFKDIDAVWQETQRFEEALISYRRKWRQLGGKLRTPDPISGADFDSSSAAGRAVGWFGQALPLIVLGLGFAWLLSR